MLRDMMAPIAATPIAAPMLRANWLSEVAIPSRERSTPCCTASSSDSIWQPIPAPSTRHDPSSSGLPEWTSSRVRPMKPSVISTLPAIATTR